MEEERKDSDLSGGENAEEGCTEIIETDEEMLPEETIDGTGCEDGEEEEEDTTGYVHVKKPKKPLFERTGILYQNQFTISREMYREFVKAFISQYRKWYYMVGAGSIIMAAVLYFIGTPTYSIFSLIVCVFCFFMPSVMYKRMKDNKYEKQVENNNNLPLERQIDFYENGIEIFSNAGANKMFLYSDITRILSSGNVYVLVIQKKLSLLVDKNGFTTGALPEWKTFMESKVKHTFK